MAEKMKLKVTKGQYLALNNIRGLQQGAHHMVMCMRETSEGIFLVGTEDQYDQLLSDLYDEVGYEMQGESNLNHLRKLIEKIEPKDDMLECQ